MVDGNDNQVGRSSFAGGDFFQLGHPKLVHEPDLVDELAILTKMPGETSTELVDARTRGGILIHRYNRHPLGFFASAKRAKLCDCRVHNRKLAFRSERPPAVRSRQG